MKIRKIALENLNSLVGEHVLDLTAEPIASAGIFAITGPTGAGKSTLLDAITLALYGRAARYGGPNPEDMMSRHQGRCRAEVEFEVDGATYRAEWIRRRARDRADGKLQPAKRFIYDAGGEPLTQKLADADAMVESLSGLDYERFMRSVLLAQGDFARFLKSKEDERAELLESLTGTAVFSSLSARVYEEAKSREQELEKEETLLGTIVPLGDEVRAEREGRLAGLEAQQKTSRAELDRVIRTLSRAEQLAQACETEKGSQAALKANQGAHDANRGRLGKLRKHRMAEPYIPQLARVDDSRAELQRLLEQAAKMGAQRSAAMSELDRGTAAAAALIERWIAERAQAVAKLKLERSRLQEAIDASDAWLENHGADAALGEQLPNLFERIEALKGERKNWSIAREKLKNLGREEAEGREAVAARQEELVKQKGISAKADAAREVAMERFEKATGGKDEAARRIDLERLGNVIEDGQKIEAGERALKSAKATVGAVQERAKAAQEKREAAAKLLAAHEEHLQTEILRAGLEDHRGQLEEGEPCPLCGATDHPFADGGAIIGGRTKELRAQVAGAKSELGEAEKSERERAKEAVERLAQIESMELALATGREAVALSLAGLGLSGASPGELKEVLQKREGELAAMVQARGELEAAIRVSDEARRGVEKLELAQVAGREAQAKVLARIDEETRDLEKAMRAGKVATAELELALAPFACEIPDPGGELDLRELLDARAKAFAKQGGRKAEATEQLRGNEQKLMALESELEKLRHRREALDPDGAIDADEWDLESLEMVEARLLELDRRVTSASASATECEKQVAVGRESLRGREAALQAALEGSGFADAAALGEVRLGADELTELSELESRLAEEANELKGRIRNSAELVAKLRGDEVPEGEALVAMQGRRETMAAAAESVGEAIGSLRAELKADDANRKALKERGATLAEKRKGLELWQRLNGLVGSADGKKFRRFAQGLSLDVLLRHANLHLERLSDRYQLARSEDEELGLEIVDRFQASVRRPMASLSGGESFLASLALALGLSDLAGRNVQIDSLFIDEGFGSLDGDSLDEAISALEALRVREKTVGVISHVELLKERISTQVVVGRDSAGRGSLQVVG